MALVAAQDLSHNTMDTRQQQRPRSDSNSTSDRDSSSQQHQQQSSLPFSQFQPSYAYPQPWNMNINGHPTPQNFYPGMPFYPGQFQHPQQAQPPFTQPPYFDPNQQAQFAQWAYQQMMYQSQQLTMSPIASSPLQSPTQQGPLPQAQVQAPPVQRSRSNPPSSPDYFSQNNHTFNNSANRYASGTPPLLSSQPSQQQSQNPGQQYQGFHPYRRPERERDRQRSHDSNNPSNGNSNVNGNSTQGPQAFQPPYARSDGTGSSSSVNSIPNSGTNSNSSQSQRPRVNSNNSNNSNGARNTSNSLNNGSMRGKPAISPTSHSPTSSSSYSHPRSPSTSSPQGSFSRNSAVPTNSTSITSASTSGARRPSPLSQGAISVSERRKSRDDSDIRGLLSSERSAGVTTPSPPVVQRTGGMKGRFRRALAFNTSQPLQEETEDESPNPADAASKKKEKEKEKGKDKLKGNGAGDDSASTHTAATTKKIKKPSRAASMFNARFNASTDNISLSSTVSSASVMIRKLGSIGRLARPPSLSGITSIFKDKNKDKDKDKSGDGSKGKGSRAEASVSHVTAELDRMGDSSGTGPDGMSPAAKLAWQHTLKTNEEAAARRSAESTQAKGQSVSPTPGTPVPSTWERNTTSRQGNIPGRASPGPVREDGMRLPVEEEDSDSDDSRRKVEERSVGSDTDEEGTWRGHGDDEEEDVTIRIGGRNGLGDLGSDEGQSEDGHEGEEPWAANVRRSIERTLKPTKGILKNASRVYHDALLDGSNPSYNHLRIRANSSESHPNPHSELGPLARIPSPDPDHIDGLHKHASHHTTSSTSSTSSSFLTNSSSDHSNDSPRSHSPPHADKQVTQSGGLFSHPGMNSSAPALSTMSTSTQPPTLTHRSATAPVKRLTFAANLSIYDTFSPSAYDRRSEPATWSHLTPALAQRIKEELNSYKMEEMEVHAASRAHTQFFV